jgi:regulator of RNase E activity RraA
VAKKGEWKMKEMVGILKGDKVRKAEIPRPSKQLVDRFQKLPDRGGLVARAMDSLGISGTIPAAVLNPISPGGSVVGPALTVRNIPEREVPYRYWERGDRTLLGEREAFFLAEPGDVVVIDGASVYPASCLGSMSVTLAGRLGVAGIIVSGAVTGVSGIRATNTPVWARGGTTITGHHRLETIEINGPIGIENIRVDPGDLVVADDSGISVVPLAWVEKVLERAEKMAQRGARFKTLLKEGADRETLRKELADEMVALMESSVK